MTTTSPLMQQALAARDHAYAPYSQFKVGAAIRAASGRVYQGVNVENAAYPEGTCAEAGAIAAMILGGDTVIAEVAVVADATVPVSPCGGCRQKLAEFGAADVPVTMANLVGASRTMTLAELLPGAFEKSHMGESTMGEH
ncbi:MAG: cytidine deaminase [Rhodobacterales bacterium]|nr:cytidine deaminase [Rhodobacterales bacterium]